MLTLCSPSWSNKEDNPKAALFGLMANRTPKEYEVENVSGTENDTSRTVSVVSLMDRNNGKEPVKYRLSVIMIREDDGTVRIYYSAGDAVVRMATAKEEDLIALCCEKRK